MNVPLQQFGYRDSRYERPTSRWVCGWAAEGRPCPMGPDGKGRCSAELQGKCEPVKRGDRWHCTRPEAFGGPCDPGPRPDGSCGRPQPTHPVCQPRLSLRARRGRLTWACVALTVGALSMLIAGSPREWFINPGPLASQHAMLEAQFGKSGSCSQCHGPDGFSQALTGGLFQPVSDTACLKCHAAPAHHPSPQQIAAGSAMAQRCADCHTEHRGPEHHLSRVADRTCTTCHGNLPAVRPQTTVARRVTSFAADHPEARLIAARAIDETPLRFEHHVHMGTDDQMQQRLAKWIESLREVGVTVPEIPVRRLDDGRLAMTCAACHQRDATGRHMLPIRFQTHCVQCHELGTRAVGDRSLAIPHGSQIGSFVRQVAVETVMLEMREPQPGAEEPAEAAPMRGPARRGPGARPAVPAAPRTPAERVDEEIRKLTQRLRTDCGKCHDPAADPLTIENPGVPDRWMAAAVFSHQAHRFMACTDCHPQAARTSPGEVPEHSTLRWTGRTKELMLPSVESCRRCHAPDAAAGSVRHDCALCHQYHAPRHEGY